MGFFFIIRSILSLIKLYITKLRKLLPFQDYKQQRPSQELVAKDLHGVEWKFRHIYRGVRLNFDRFVWKFPYFLSILTHWILNLGIGFCVFRSTEATFAYYRVEHFCKPEESRFWGCSSLSKVSLHHSMRILCIFSGLIR